MRVSRILGYALWLSFPVLGVVTLASLPAADLDARVAEQEAKRIAVIEKVKPSVVAVFGAGGAGGGSGVLISKDGYALTNFRAGFRTPHGIDVSAWVRNAFDTNYIELLQVAPSNVGLIVGNPGDPRTFGGTIKVSF